MIGDAARGVNYELCVALAPKETQLLMLSGSVSNPQDIVSWLENIGRKPALVSMNKRPVPLEEVYLDAMSQNPPRSVTGFWPRMVAKALMADYGPILIFSPQRKNAESMARQLAASLPDDNPLPLSPAQKRLAGPLLERLLNKRVAFHHSGLSYQQRAGLVEPLAKAGQLRIVVSTTGLAAGVNFSMRSVLVTDSQFTIGHTQQLIRPDELLQMFGRAGRRGMDTIGYALVAPDRPRLREGRQRPVKRPKMLDWPSMIAVLGAAANRGENPFPAAIEVCKRLFDQTPVTLGVEHCLADGERGCGLMVDAERARYAQPESVEILNSSGDWEPRQQPRRAALSSAKIRRKTKLKPALEDAAFVETLGEGRLARIRAERGNQYFGKRLPIGFRDKKDPESAQLAGWLKNAMRQAGVEPLKRYALAELEALDWAKLATGGNLCALQWKGYRLFGLFDFSNTLYDVDIDVSGVALIEAETRKAYPVECQNCSQHAVCESDLSPARSEAISWRRLGLIERKGKPTRRGAIFSLFQGGEGLAIAAALEEESYSVDAIAHDIANLRAGHRFSDYSQYSHRLARACRVAYSDRSYDGYLKHGLPLHYGEGAAEVIAEWAESRGKGRKTLGDDLRYGDVQRARLEWLSLLRHIDHAPELDWDRWQELQESARALLETDDLRLQVDDLPPLEASQAGRVNHLLRFPRGS